LVALCPLVLWVYQRRCWFDRPLFFNGWVGEFRYLCRHLRSPVIKDGRFLALFYWISHTWACLILILWDLLISSCPYSWIIHVFIGLSGILRGNFPKRANNLSLYPGLDKFLFFYFVLRFQLEGIPSLPSRRNSYPWLRALGSESLRQEERVMSWRIVILPLCRRSCNRVQVTNLELWLILITALNS